MNINEMTTAEIEAYLEERKSRKPKLGGTVKLVSEMKPGEHGWVEIKILSRASVVVGSNSAYPLQFDADQLIETNVPERAPARRRMTAAEAAEELEVGQEVWVKSKITDTVSGSPLPVEISEVQGIGFWLAQSTQIEVEA